MKQIILFSIILVQSTCYGQVENDYLENAEWQLFYTCEPEQNFFEQVELKLKTGEDTLIAGFSYKKVHLDNQTNAQFFLRQEESKLYYRSSNPTADSVEYEVYDFSLEVGQSFVYPLEFYQTEYVVSSIDSIELLDGTKRKRITFADTYNVPCAPVAEITQWIEGIGGVPTPVYFFEDYCWCEFRGFTFSAYGVLLYESDILIDNVNETEKTNLDFRQNNNQIVVLSDAQIDRLIIHSIDGRAIAELEGSHTIQIDHLNNGIYILEVIFKNQTRGSIKFLK